jgi:hypothetical protein
MHYIGKLCTVTLAPAKFAFLDFKFEVVYFDDSEGIFDESSNLIMPAEEYGGAANWVQYVDFTLAPHLDTQSTKTHSWLHAVLRSFLLRTS